ncbi:MAG: TolC family protein [Sedimentisphaerales bacterium]|jgi:outer membrane protein TolC
MLAKKFSILYKTAITLGLLVAMCLLSSCAEPEATDKQDYIGPSDSQPAIQPSLETGKMQEPNSSPIVKIEPNGPIDITINEAVLISLQKNKSLAVEKLSPQIKRTFEQQALAVFDPDLKGTVSGGKTRLESPPAPGSGPVKETEKTFGADASLSEFLPTGTTLSLDGSTSWLDESFAADPFVSTRLGGSVTQSLLRGFGTAVNLVSVNQARIDTKISQYELRGFVESLVAQIEEAYWNCSLAEKSIEIYEQSMQVAEKQQQETEERINIGSLARSELAAAKAETALRQQDLIVAENTLAQSRLNLLRLLNPSGNEMWDRKIILKSEPTTPEIELSPVETYVLRGWQMRPELNQARLQLDRDELEIVRTRNGLLPQLDFFITLGKTGYSDSFDDSARNIFKKNDYDVAAGITFEYPLMNRLAQAKNQQATLLRQQAQEALGNLEQLVEVDIRGAYLQITSVQQQVVAAKASRELLEEKLKVETGKFEVGKSTSILVAQAQRDFLQSQITELTAAINYQIAIVELHRLEGTLLMRSGIASPGSEPVKQSKITSS